MSDWISVEDRLPLESTYGLKGLEEVKVLATDGFDVCAVAFQRGSGGGMPWRDFDKYAEISNYSITHWMPLPEPPKEPKND